MADKEDGNLGSCPDSSTNLSKASPSLDFRLSICHVSEWDSPGLQTPFSPQIPG